MKTKLTKMDKSKAKAILTLLVASLLMQRMAEAAKKPLGENHAVNHATAYIDETLTTHMSQPVAEEVKHRVNRARRKLTAEMHSAELIDALLGTLLVLTDVRHFKTAPATRLDYIVGTFRKNLKAMESLPHDAKSVRAFKVQLLKALDSI